MAKKIFLISGFCDIQRAGNQTLKNTLKYLNKAGFDIHCFSSLPDGYPNLLTPQEVFDDKVRFRRFPGALNLFFVFFRWLKNKFKKKIRRGIPSIYFSPGEAGEYFADFRASVQFLYFFSWLFCVLFELSRVFFAALKERPDVFYGYEICGATVAAILGIIFKKPVITRFQGTALNAKKKFQWKYFPHHVLGLKSRANAIIMCNDGTRGDEVLKELGIPENKIYFWMNGLDEGVFGVNRDGIGEIRKKLGIGNKKVILSASKLKIWKRIDRIIFVLKILREKYKIEPVLLIAGDGPEKKNLEELVSFYKLSDSVIFLGGISHNEMKNYFQLADVFLITNDISNLSNQTMEALYFGLPVVSLKDGSTDELLQNGYNALLVPLDKIEEELPKAVYKVLADDGLAKKLGENAKLTAKEKVLTWEERMKKEIELINRLIKER